MQSCNLQNTHIYIHIHANTDTHTYINRNPWQIIETMTKLRQRQR